MATNNSGNNLYNVTYKVDNIDLTSLVATKIVTTAAGSGIFIPQNLIIRCTAANSVSVAASVSVGTNSTSYNNILAISALTGVTSSGLCIQIPCTLFTQVAATTDIFIKVTTGITGTSELVSAYLQGFYV